MDSEYKNIELEPSVRQLISAKVAWKYRVIPFHVNNDSIHFYSDIIDNIDDLSNELEVLLGKKIIIENLDHAALSEILSKYYPKKDNNELRAINPGSEDFIIQLIEEAKSLRSSDLHLEPYESFCRVRIRVDGKLVERYTIEKNEYPAVINKIKIMSHLDIAEKRLPQDGRIFFKTASNKFDIRVSILPSLFGEKIVLRILSNDATNLDIKELGFSQIDLQRYLESVRRPHGIILISGPTGSGKTTTLYATLKYLNSKDRNILTIEDPIEYTLEGINQVQLKEQIGLDFSKALKTFLRQDPDIMMVGEIRDKDTAQMAIRAALTGHLVLSTIHTNSAWGIVSRLIDMGIPSYLVSSTLNVTIAQRLIRLLCDKCKKKIEVEEESFATELNQRNFPKFHYEATGCSDCFYTGYNGRKAIYEVIPIDEDLQEMIKKTDLQVNSILNKKKILLLSDQAFNLFFEGRTTFEEIYPYLSN